MSTKSYCLTKWLSNLGPVHTYPDIFATFSFQIQKFPRPHIRGFVAESGFKTYWIHRTRLDGSGFKKYAWTGP